MGGRHGARQVFGAFGVVHQAYDTVSILSSTLTPTVHPSFPLRFIPYSTVFPVPESDAPAPDVVVDIIGSFVGSKRPGQSGSSISAMSN